MHRGPPVWLSSLGVVPALILAAVVLAVHSTWSNKTAALLTAETAHAVLADAEAEVVHRIAFQVRNVSDSPLDIQAWAPGCKWFQVTIPNSHIPAGSAAEVAADVHLMHSPVFGTLFVAPKGMTSDPLRLTFDVAPKVSTRLWTVPSTILVRRGRLLHVGEDIATVALFAESATAGPPALVEAHSPSGCNVQFGPGWMATTRTRWMRYVTVIAAEKTVGLPVQVAFSSVGWTNARVSITYD